MSDLHQAVEGVVEEAAGEIYEIGHAHGGNAHRASLGLRAERTNEGWGPVAGKAVDRILDAIRQASMPDGQPEPVDLAEVRERGLQVARILATAWPFDMPAVFGLHMSGDVGHMLQELEHLRLRIAAGVLLPMPTETREERGVQHYDGPIQFAPAPPPRVISPNVRLYRRTVRTFADGAVLIGAWEPLPTDAE